MGEVVQRENAAIWPTPNSRDAKPGTARPHGGGRKGQAPQTNLNDLVLRWPTPCATGYKGPGKTPRDRLDHAVNGATKSAVYPTPQTDHMGGGEMARKRLRKLQADGVLSAEETRGLMMRTVGKQLNPDWEEWLMAWPVGWTDLETPNIRLVWLDPSIDPADYGEIPRITNRRDNRPARVKEIGNGQFPLTAAAAFHWGLCVLQLANQGEK
jgi:hypothetical protein